MDKATCTAPDCGSLVLAKGLCNAHYKRLRTYGQLDLPDQPSFEERFWARVDKTPTCWLWRGVLDAHGYGKVSAPAGMFGTCRTVLAHRVAYSLTHDSAPEFLDHRCRNRSCVRPDHLRPVTKKQNNEHRGPAPSSTTKVRGVSLDRRINRYRVQVIHNGRNYGGGYHRELADAEAAAIALRNKLFTHNDLDRQPPVQVDLGLD